MIIGREESRDFIRRSNSLLLARGTNLTAENESASNYVSRNHPPSGNGSAVHKGLG